MKDKSELTDLFTIKFKFPQFYLYVAGSTKANGIDHWAEFSTLDVGLIVYTTQLPFITNTNYCMLLSKVHTFFIENDAEMLLAHYTWKVAFTNLIHKQSIQRPYA